jgi:tRNA pseudouridine38-40 synthase
MERNIILTIEYDGTDFVGWQRQRNGRSVQEEIETTLTRITQQPVTIVGAGRTDSGVHARGQVANFVTESGMPLNELQRALNGLLPEDIVIHSVTEGDSAFSARYSAKAREYRYYIALQPTAVNRKYSWHLGYAFEINSMKRTAASILGVHEFQSFCKSDSVTEHHRCEVFISDWEKKDGTLIYTVKANRFLQGMVRALVGTMVNVGRGFTPENEFERILSEKNRSAAGQSAPAKGLFLEHVTY